MKRHLISAGVTFISSFLTVLGAALITVPAESWTEATWYSVLAGLALTAVRGAVKPTVESYLRTE